MEKIKFFDFVKSHKSHIFSLTIFTIIGTVAPVFILSQREEFDPQWTAYLAASFNVLIGILGWYRVYEIWKRL